MGILYVVLALDASIDDVGGSKKEVMMLVVLITCSGEGERIVMREIEG